MNSEYLWDGSGPVDEDVRALEETLASLRYESRAVPFVAPKRVPWRAVAIGSLAVAAAALLWAGTRASNTGIFAERRGAEAHGAAALSASGEASELGVLTPQFPQWKPGGKSGAKAAGSAVLDPWGDPNRELSPAAVRRVVTAKKHLLHRRCFIPASTTTSYYKPDSVRVEVRLKITPGGRVSSATTTGDELGYKGLTNCVSKEARGWRFPVSKKGATVQVPLVFKSSDNFGLKDPFKNAPAPSVPKSKVVDPWNAPPASSSDLLDAMRKAQKPKVPKSTVVDPWQRPSKNSKKGLTSTQIQSEISRMAVGVKRSCWAGRKWPADAPKSARVQVSLVVAPSGKVSRATGTAARGYAGLRECILTQARGWRFPAAKGSTTINVPFVFARM